MVQPATTTAAAGAGKKAGGQLIESLLRKLPPESRFPKLVRTNSMVVSTSTDSASPEQIAASPPQLQLRPVGRDTTARMRFGAGAVPPSPMSPSGASVASLEHGGRVASVRSDATIGGMIPDLPRHRLPPSHSLPVPTQQRHQPSRWPAAVSAVNRFRSPSPLSTGVQQRQAEIQPAASSSLAARRRHPEIQPVQVPARTSSPGTGPEAFSPVSVTSNHPGGLPSPNSHFRTVSMRLEREMQVEPRHVSPQVYAYAYGPPSSKGPRSYAAQRRSVSAGPQAKGPRSWAAEHRVEAQGQLQQQGSRPRSYAAEKRAEDLARRSTSAPPVGRSFAAITHAAVAAQRMAAAAKSYAARRQQALSNERGSTVASNLDARSFAARRRAEAGGQDEGSKSYAARKRDERRGSISPPSPHSMAAERHRSASRSPSPAGSQSFAARRRSEAQVQSPPRARSLAAQRFADREASGPKSFAAMRRAEAEPHAGQPHSIAAQRRRERMDVAAVAGAAVAGKSWAAKARQSRQEAVQAAEQPGPMPAPKLQKSMSEHVSPPIAGHTGPSSPRDSLKRTNTAPKTYLSRLEKGPDMAQGDAKAGADKLGDIAVLKDAHIRQGAPLKDAGLKSSLVGAAVAGGAAVSTAAAALEASEKRSSTPEVTGPSAPASRVSSHADLGPMADPFATAAAQFTVAAGAGALSSPRPSSPGAALLGAAAATAAGMMPAASPQKRAVKTGHKKSKSMSATVAAAAARATAGGVPASPPPGSPQKQAVGLGEVQSPLVVLPHTMQPILVSFADVRPTRAVSPLRYSSEHFTGRMRPMSPATGAAGQPASCVPGGKRQVPEPEPVIQGYVIPTSRIPRLVSSARRAHSAAPQHVSFLTGPLPQTPMYEEDTRPTRGQAADGRWTAQVLQVRPASPSTQPTFPAASQSGRSVFGSMEGLGVPLPPSSLHRPLSPTRPLGSRLLRDPVDSYAQVMRDVARFKGGSPDDDAASSIPSEDTVDALMLRDQHPLLPVDMNRMPSLGSGGVKGTVRILKDPSDAGRGIRLLKPQQLGASAALAAADSCIKTQQDSASSQQPSSGPPPADLQGPDPAAGTCSTSSAHAVHPEPVLLRTRSERPVTHVRTLAPPTLPHQDRHLPLLRMQSRVPAEPPHGSTRLLRVERGRVFVHPHTQPGQDPLPTYIGGHMPDDVAPMPGEAHVFTGLQGHPPLVADGYVSISSGGHLLRMPEGHTGGPGGLSSTAGASTADRTAQLLGALNAKAPGALHGALPFGINPDVAATSGVVPYPGEAIAGRRLDGGQMHVPVTIPGLGLGAGPAAPSGMQLPLGALSGLSALTALSRLSNLAAGNAFFGEDDPSSWPTLQETTPASLKLTAELLRPQRSPRQLGPGDYAQLAGMVPRVVLDYMQDGLVDRIPAAPDAAAMGFGQAQQQLAHGARFTGAAGLPAADMPQGGGLQSGDAAGPHPLTSPGIPPLPHFVPAPGYPAAHLVHPASMQPQFLAGSQLQQPLPVPPGVSPPMSVPYQGTGNPYQATANASPDKQPLNLTFATNLRVSTEGSPSPKRLVPSGPTQQAHSPRSPSSPPCTRASGSQLSSLLEGDEHHTHPQPELGFHGPADEQQTPRKIPGAAPRRSLDRDLKAADLPQLPQSKFRPSDTGSDLEGGSKEAASGRAAAGVGAGAAGALAGGKGKDVGGPKQDSKQEGQGGKKKRQGRKRQGKNKGQLNSSESDSSPSSPSSSSSSSASSGGSDSDSSDGCGKGKKRGSKHKGKGDEQKRGQGEAAGGKASDAEVEEHSADGMQAAERLLAQMGDAVRGPRSQPSHNDPAAAASRPATGTGDAAVAVAAAAEVGVVPLAASAFLTMDDILHSSRIEEKARETVDSWRAKRAAAAKEAAAQRQQQAAAAANNGAVRALAPEAAHSAADVPVPPYPINSVSALGATVPIAAAAVPPEDLQLQLSMALVNALTGTRAADGSVTAAIQAGAPIQIFCTNLNLPQQPAPGAGSAQPASAGPALENTAGTASTWGSDAGGTGRATGRVPDATQTAVQAAPTVDVVQAGVQTDKVPADVKSTESQTLDSASHAAATQEPVQQSAAATPLAAAPTVAAGEASSPFKGDGSAQATTSTPQAVLSPHAPPSAPTSAAPGHNPDSAEAMASELTALILKVFAEGRGVVGAEEEAGPTAVDGTSSSEGTGSAASAAEGQFYLTSLYSTSSGQPTLIRQPAHQAAGQAGSTQHSSGPSLRPAAELSLANAADVLPAAAAAVPAIGSQSAFLTVLDQGPVAGALPGLLPNPSVPRGAPAPGFLQVMDIVPVGQAPVLPQQQHGAGSDIVQGQQGTSAMQHRLEHMRQRMQWQIAQVAQVVQQGQPVQQVAHRLAPAPSLAGTIPTAAVNMHAAGAPGSPSRYYPPVPSFPGGPTSPPRLAYPGSVHTGSSAASFAAGHPYPYPYPQGPGPTLAPTMGHSFAPPHTQHMPTAQQVAMQVVARLPPATVCATGVPPLHPYPAVPSARWDAAAAQQHAPLSGAGPGHSTFTFQAAPPHGWPGSPGGPQSGSPGAQLHSGSPHMSPTRGGGSYVQLLTAAGPGSITRAGIVNQSVQQYPSMQQGQQQMVQQQQHVGHAHAARAADARVSQRDENRRMVLDAWASEMRDISSAVSRAEVANQVARMASQHAAQQRAAAREAEVGGLLDALADVDKIAREIEEEARDTRRMMQELEEWNALSGTRELNRLMVEARHLGDTVEGLLGDQQGQVGGEMPDVLESYQLYQQSQQQQQQSQHQKHPQLGIGNEQGVRPSAGAAVGDDDDEGAKPWAVPDR